MRRRALLSRKVNEADKFKYTNSVSGLETITVPAASGTNNFMIDWGDGSAIEHVTIASPSHEYTLAGSYQTSIWGNMLDFGFSNGGSKLNVISIDQFGNTGLTSVSGFAHGCSNCTLINGSDFDTSLIAVFGNFADQCSSLTTFSVGTWDMGSATTLAAFIRDAPLLTSLNVSGWTIPNVTSTALFAARSGIVTLDTNAWDTRSITNCTQMAVNCDDLTSSFDEYRWWNRTDDLTSGGTPDPIGAFSDTFTNDFNISNYASIPNNWKGL